MKQRLLHLAEHLRASFWAVPALMTVTAILLSQGLQLLDEALQLRDLPGLGWVRLDDPDSARLLLSTIAGSTITVAGTVFSITIVALTLASNQFGPRLVRNFMRDRGTQLSLGTFLATFVYALMTMRGIDDTDNAARLDLAVHVATLLSLISIAVLIYFIHNVALSIQVDNVTYHISREFSEAINQHYPSARNTDEHADCCDVSQLNLGDDCLSVYGDNGGYVLRTDRQKILDWATRNHCCVVLDCHPGSYIHHWSRIARVYQPPRQIDSGEVTSLICGAISTGHQPTAEQDIVFSIHQLVQIAVRALSPGINDPFTAYSCIDRLVDGIGKVLQRPQLPNCFRDERGELRLVTSVLDFSDLLAAAFDEIREYGRSSGVVMRHLLNKLGDLAQICTRAEDRRALDNYLDRLTEDCNKFVGDQFDRQAIGKKIHNIRLQIARR